MSRVQPTTRRDGQAGGAPNGGRLAGPADLAARVRQRGLQAGLAAVGIAPATLMESTRRIIEQRKAAGLAAGMQFTYRNPARSTDPARALPGAAALVAGAWAYGPVRASGHPRAAGTVEGAELVANRPRGRIARYAWQDHYGSLRTALAQVADTLRGAGWRARVLVDDNSLVDRAVAELAGVGWFGKNSNILLPGRGSWFVLGSVVTDAPLSPDVRSRGTCGPCQRCLQACPAGALAAPGVVDARRCLAWLLQRPGVFPWEHREALGDRIYGCDDCQEVCPVNRLAARAAPSVGPGEAGALERHEVDVLEMLEASDGELLSSHGRWYIPHRDPRYLRRNALIVLGNSGDGSSQAVERALRAHLTHPDELLRAHAIWAAARLGREDLVASAEPALTADPSLLVRDELARLGQVRPAWPRTGRLLAG